jgi:hypothetical protein
MLIRESVNCLELDKLDLPSGYHRSGQTLSTLGLPRNGLRPWSVRPAVYICCAIGVTALLPLVHLASTRYLGKNWGYLRTCIFSYSPATLCQSQRVVFVKGFGFSALRLAAQVEVIIVTSGWRSPFA